VCGIVLLQGPNAGARLPECLDRLRHRGPDDSSVWVGDDVALGFTRLAINGEGLSGRQPYRHGGLVGAINGEVYNHRELAHAYGLTPSECDAQVLLPLLDLQGPQVIDELDGFYAAVAFRPSTREVLCLRDHIGKKPLFVGRSQGEVFITSELKALERIDWFQLLPRGVTQVQLDTGRLTQVADHRPVRPQADVADLLEDAVRKRMPRPNQPVGVFLSGGLDSSLVAALASQLRDDVTYFTLGDPDDPDRRAVETVVDALGLRDVRVVPVPSSAQIPELVRSVVYATESYNPSVVSNGLATFLLAQAAHENGIKVVLTGEGADELFGGYHSFREEDPWREVRAQLLDDMHFTELRRLDMSCMAHSVEARCPFLDRAVRGFSDRLAYDEMYGGEENKITLRRSFEGVLPPSILHRPKTSFDVGSGIRRQVVRYLRRNGRGERQELLELWRQHFAYDASEPYFHSYPVFDEAIDRRGMTHR
jgi:asparagine synthase (glutamine-hydrolysing)